MQNFVTSSLCTRDEGRPLRADLQEQAPNHLKLLCSKAILTIAPWPQVAKASEKRWVTPCSFLAVLSLVKRKFL